MAQTKEMKSSKGQKETYEAYETCDHLYFLGSKFPYREVDGLKVATERLENILLDFISCSEARELLEEIAYFCREKDLFTLSEEKIREIFYP